MASHDDIVAKAKGEGELKVYSTMDPASIKLIRESFPKKYPFLKFDLRELTGTEDLVTYTGLAAGGLR